jgi:CheY-like chemotaxis protein/two-component sensor histidine kinase
MNGILGFAYLLKDPDLSDENKKAYIHIIQKSGDRMLNTINDLINISKIEAGQEKATMEKVDVNQAMYDTFEFFQPECKNKGLNIYFEERLKDEEKIVYSDSDKLSSILTNLVKNAVKFTEDGCVEIGCEKKGEYIEFFVKDTGIGIPENRQEAIFDRFVQADIDDRSVYEGSGLGLSITKSYVDMLGGRIWLRSSEGYGTHFYFTIPFKPYDEKVIDASPESGKAIDLLKENKLKILVAEDDTTSYEYISIILEEVTDEILQAENGKKAVDLIHSHPDIDLILMDVKMPVMDGYTATKQIREFNDEVKIIAQTAYSLPNDKQKALQNGCNAFITKPTNKDELLSMIDELMLSRKC